MDSRFPHIKDQKDLDREARRHRLSMVLIAIQPLLLIAVTVVALILATDLAHIIQAVSR